MVNEFRHMGEQVSLATDWNDFNCLVESKSILKIVQHIRNIDLLLLLIFGTFPPSVNIWNRPCLMEWSSVLMSQEGGSGSDHSVLGEGS